MEKTIFFEDGVEIPASELQELYGTEFSMAPIDSIKHGHDGRWIYVRYSEFR